MVPRGDAGPQCVVITTLVSVSQRHPGNIRSHPGIRNPSIHLQLQQRGDDDGGPLFDAAPHNVKTPTWGS